MRTLWSQDTNLKGPVPTGFWAKSLREVMTACGLTMRPVFRVNASSSAASWRLSRNWTVSGSTTMVSAIEP
jgi:hypothetical protein